MYLKSIEIQGFKSFANKIVFEFHNGITGIVGPNGSGKSNVADAVRWVLGEQKVKQLRSSSMQDVIFAGTETRKPQGFAYVAITLDNSDHQLAIEYDQVTVSRRVYRSGESEYMINRSACRLKDIQELFYDTGIGKEGYSIIGQGQIDKILSGRPEERRELFDEAAGIVKFKRRKAITQKKLEDEKQNLVRVNDILSELEKQVGPLAKQSETAREYLRLREELRNLEANVFLSEEREIRDQKKELEEKAAIVSKDMEETKHSSESLRLEYDALDQLLASLDKEIDQAVQAASQAAMKKNSLEGQIHVLEEQINTERMNGEHIRQRMEAIRSELEEKKNQTLSYETERQELWQQEQETDGRLGAARSQVAEKEGQIGRLEHSIDAGKGSLIDTLNQKTSLASRQQRYETMLEQVNVRRSQVCQQLLKYKSDESEQDIQLTEFNLQAEETGQAISQIEIEEAQAQNRTEELEAEAKRLGKRLNDKQQEYHTNRTKLESLQNLAERYEGYGGSIRRVMETRDRIHGIHGVVADLITVEKKYEVAVETALGGSIQNVVTDSEQTAKRLIEYLKKNKYGRATFLPLTSIGNRNTFTQEKALKEPGVLGLANTLVKARPEYEGLLRYLLGRVVVADTVDNAVALARKYQYSLRIVTLEGELLSPGGSMTGGAFKNTSNLLGRKREIDELEAACKKAVLDVELIEKDLAVNEGLLTESRETEEELRVKKQNLYLNQNTVQNQISRIEDKKREIKDSYGDLERENGQLEEQIREITETLKNLEQSMKELEGRNQETNVSLKQWNTALEIAKKEREDLAANLSQIQMESSNLRQKTDFVQANLSRIREEEKRLKQELSGLEGGEENSRQAIEEKKRGIEDLRQEAADAGAEEKSFDRTVREKRSHKEANSGRQKELFQKREEFNNRTALLDREMFRLDNQMEKLNERLEAQTDYMWKEYELTFSSAQALRWEENVPLPQLRKMSASLREDIRRLGNVNVNAIEDYKEISQRYEFMKTQHDDLVEAEKTLLDLIDQLDRGMRVQFEEKFQEIRKEFDKVFKELFGGGKGTLELVEGEDLLEAGIQIISQPPGKKLQNMMQLSGGEKALTAIALLFAIQNLKPSPFCLLDEIEAALDDSNVDRFAKYLHKLTRYTQFIVITHRRGTMVAADRLYGITMQEKGVSTLISVNLIEEDLDQ